MLCRKEAGYIYHKFDPIKMQFLSQFDMEKWPVSSNIKLPVIKLTRETPNEAVCQVFENVKQVV
jgi:hypothetical protein